jgi:hypothetical protein
VVGRNYAYQTPSSVTLFFEDKNFNSFMGAGGLGLAIDEFNGDNFDHSGLGFIGGGFIQAGSNGARPIEVRPVPAGTPRWVRSGRRRPRNISTALSRSPSRAHARVTAPTTSTSIPPTATPMGCRFCA